MSALHIRARLPDAVDELHPQPIAPLGLPELIHAHDVRMFEVGHYLGLAAKVPDGFGARGEIRRQQLECVTPFERRVLHFIHLAHAAAAQQSHDAILPELGVDAE